MQILITIETLKQSRRSKRGLVLTVDEPTSEEGANVLAYHALERNILPSILKISEEFADWDEINIRLEKL